MELSPIERIQNLPKRPKRYAINKNWTQNNYASNFYTIKFKQNIRNIYQYSFQCEPPLPEQSRQLLIQVVKNAQPYLKKEISLFSYKGNMIWGLSKAKTTILTVQSFVMNGQKGQKKVKQNHLVHLKIAKEFDLFQDSYITDFGKKILQVLNIKFKQSLRNRDYIQITRNKYYTRFQLQEQKNNVFTQLNLRTLRGFSFTFVPLIQHDLKARLDLSTKYIQLRNLLQLLKSCDSKDAQMQLIGRYVLTYYGNFKLYKIEDIDYEKSPLSEFSLTNQQKILSYKDYFFIKYNKKIMDLKQPLLKVITKIDKRTDLNGKIQEIPTYGYMVPELVKLSGVTDDQFQNREFKQVVKKIRKNPQQINVDCQKIRQQFCQISKDSVFQIGEQHCVRGYELPRIDYQTSSKKTCQKDEINVLQSIMNPMKLQKNSWIMIYGSSNKKSAQQILKAIEFAQKRLGIKVENPIMNQINQRQERKFIAQAKQTIKKHAPKFVLVVLNRFQERYYSGLKKLFINQLHIGSQFIKSGTIYSKIKQHKSIASIISKLLLQINVKLGLPIWKILKKNNYWIKGTVMICAIGVKKSLKNKSKCSLSFVGTTCSYMTQFYSDCKINLNKIQGVLPKKEMINIFDQWIKTYLEKEKYLPDSIIIYRQGSSQYEIIKQSQIQISSLKQVLQICSKQKNKIPSIVYIHVNKRTDSKFYQMELQAKGQKIYRNPLPGTVILQDLSQGEIFDFHLVAQKVTQGTAAPTQYKILFNDSEIPQDALVQLTHQQCYNYANWTGPVKVPSCLQYVSKLSSLMTEHIKQQLSCSENFKRNLFFL